MNVKTPARVLFFGRAGCEGTSKLRALMAASGFDVSYIESAGFGEAMPPEAEDWAGDYIFCYRSYFILRAPLIARAEVAAINFHPGPPEYPGSGCLNFALYEDAAAYGVTAHLINEKVDNGAILKVTRFAVQPEDTVPSLLARSHAALQGLALEVVSGIAAEGRGYVAACLAAAEEEAWRGEARKMRELTALQRITPEIGEAELSRRIRAAHTRGHPLHLEIHGKRFVLDHD